MTARLGMASCAVAAMLVATVPSAAGRPLTVRADPAVAACLTKAIRSFEATGGGAVRLEVGPPDGTADVVAGHGATMTRLVENGPLDPSLEVVLPPIRWVLVGSGGTTVLVPAGETGLAARRAIARTKGLHLESARSLEQLGSAPRALVPETMAGGAQATLIDAPPLVLTLAPTAGGPHQLQAQAFVAFVAKGLDDGSLALCGTKALPRTAVPAGISNAPCTGPHAQSNAVAVADWWVPRASLAVNELNDPQQALGPPNAIGGRGSYQNFISLGAAGYVTLDMGGCVPDGPGPDVRVYQFVSSEPVTVYAGSAPNGPFTVVGYRETCSRNCDFDFANAATPLGEVRYLKVEDGELFASNGGGGTNGADLDAVATLH